MELVRAAPTRAPVGSQTYMYDTAGLMLLRLLPNLKELYLRGMPQGSDYESIGQSLAVLTTLECLGMDDWGDDGYSYDDKKEGAWHLTGLTRLTYLGMYDSTLHADDIQHFAGEMLQLSIMSRPGMILHVTLQVDGRIPIHTDMKSATTTNA